MDDQPPSPEFSEAFSESFCEDLRQALDAAYEIAAEKHEPAVGSDALTFGVTLYRFVWHRLQALVERHPETLKVERIGNTDRLYLGKYVLGCYRVGSSADADIHRSFPSNDEGAMTMMIDPRQQFFPGMELKPEDFADHRNYVIAHLGNPEDGLGAIYLCIPAGEFGQKVRRWAYTHLVWRRCEAKAQRPVDSTPSKLLPPAPPPEDVHDFEVPRRRRRKTDDESPTE